MFLKEINKNNLHHAYLLEGDREQVVSEIFKLLESIGLVTVGSPDVSHIVLDSFKIDDARNLKSYALERGYSASKKIFIISTNSFLLEAQNSLLKLFEEPIENTHFFVIVPDANILLPTLLSRFYFISARQDLAEGKSKDLQEAERFIKMPIYLRLEFVKDLIREVEEDEENEISTTSARSKSIQFLNSLESFLHHKVSKGTFDTNLFHHMFKVREFLRQPGSATKTLMESVALMIPVIP